MCYKPENSTSNETVKQNNEGIISFIDDYGLESNTE
jgi:hypothetical protein